MSDFAKLLANIGGALSAQGTGGSQGLQNFMATLAQQQAQQAAQDFRRETMDREQMFTLARDRASRAHEERMLDKRLAAETSEENERFRLVAGGIYQHALLTPENRQGIEEQLYKTLPELTATDTVIDWDNQAQTQSYIEAAARSGFTLAGARDVTALSSARAQWYRDATGGALEPVAGDNAEPEYAQERLRYQTAQQTLSGLQSKLAAAQEEATDLEKRSSSLSPGEYRAQALALAQKTVALGRDLDDSQAAHPQFFGDGAGLRSVADSLATSIGTLEDTIYKDQRAKGAAELGSWSPLNPERFPGFMEGFGGHPDEGTEFGWLLEQPAFRERLNPEWKGHVDFYDALFSHDLQYLDPQQRALYQTLKEERDAYGEGRVYDLATLLRARRAATHSGDSDRVALLDSIIRDVQDTDPLAVSRDIQAGRGAKNAVDNTRRFGRTLDVNNALGFALFQSDDEIRQALAAHGQQNDLGYFEMPQDTNAFLADYVASEVGMSRLGSGLMQNLMGEGAVPADVALDQLIERGNYALEKLGLATGTNRDRLRAELQARTGQQASIEPAGGAIPNIHDYTFRIERFNPGSTNDYGGQLEPAELAQWEEGFEKTIFTTPVNPEDAATLAASIISKFREGRAPYTQDWATIFDPARITGDEKRLRLRAEAAGETDTAATFYDLFGLYRDMVPTFASVAAAPGRVRDQAIVGHSRPFSVTRGGGFSPAPTEVLYASWASRGDAASMIRGNDSFARQYEMSTPIDERDENLVNMLGYIDFMRGYDLRNDVQGMRPEERKLMLGIQTHLRNLDLNAAVAAISGPAPTGFGFEDLGLALASPETSEAEAALVSNRPLSERVLDPEAEARGIRDAQRALTRIGSGDYVDIDPRPSVDDHLVIEAKVIEAEEERLNEAKARVAIVADARNYPMLHDTGMQLADVLLQGPISSPEDLHAVTEAALPTIAGVQIDALGLEKGSEQELTDRVGKSPNARVALNRVLDVFKYSDFKQLQARAVSLSTTVPMVTRNMVIQEKRLQIGQIAREVAVIRKGLAKRLDPKTGKFDPDSVPVALRSALETTNFSDLAAKSDSESLGYMAMQLWAAHRQVSDY